MTTNLFVITNVKQLRTGGSFLILLLKLLTVSPEGEMPLRRYKYRHKASEYSTRLIYILEAAVAYPGILFGGGGGSTNSAEDRENRDLGTVAPLVRGSGGSCNLVQEMSFHVLKCS